MLTTKTKAQALRQAIEAWKNEGLLDEEKANQLDESIEVLPFDWKRLARYSFVISVLCFAVAAVSLASLPLFAFLFADPANRMIIAGTISTMLYYWGITRMKENPLYRFSNEAIMLAAVFATAWAVAEIGIILDSGGGRFSILLLLACLIYLYIGWLTKSTMAWLFALISMGVWLDAATRYISGWGAYYFAMHYPLLFVAFGGLVTAAALNFESFKGFKPLFGVTLKTGLFYLFMALWIMSIFGNSTGRFWRRPGVFELVVFVLLFAAVAVWAIWLGMKKDSAVLRGYGLVFLLINIYTRFFEHFWGELNIGIFFGILGLSLWLLGSKAERIWRSLQDGTLLLR